jgi:hypothetical protein
LLVDGDHYEELIARAVAGAGISVWITTANLKTMLIDEEIVPEGGQPRPALRLAFADRASLGLFAAANVVPMLFFWPAIEGWAKSSLTFWTGR